MKRKADTTTPSTLAYPSMAAMGPALSQARVGGLGKGQGMTPDAPLSLSPVVSVSVVELQQPGAGPGGKMLAARRGGSGRPIKPPRKVSPSVFSFLLSMLIFHLSLKTVVIH